MLATFGSEGKLLSSIVGLQLVSENLHCRPLWLRVEEVVAAGAEKGRQGGGEGVGWGRGEVGRVARGWGRVVAGHVWRGEVLGWGGRLGRHGGEGSRVEGGQWGPLATILLQQSWAAWMRGRVVFLWSKSKRVATWRRGWWPWHLGILSIGMGGLQAREIISMFKIWSASHLFASLGLDVGLRACRPVVRSPGTVAGDFLLVQTLRLAELGTPVLEPHLQRKSVKI